MYAGIDPTAGYLHVGHLVPLLSLFHFHIRGHRVIPLVCLLLFITQNPSHLTQIGGATGLVGDPSGRDTERPLASLAVVEDNVRTLKSAVTKFFSSVDRYVRRRAPTAAFQESEVKAKNNVKWFQHMDLLEFLRTVGIHARVNSMIARDRYGFLAHDLWVYRVYALVPVSSRD